MGYFKNKLIEEKEMTMNDIVRFDLEQKDAMEHYYKTHDLIYRKANYYDKILYIAFYLVLGMTCVGLGIMLASVFIWGL